MECPYCKKIMKEGYLTAQSKIVWSEKPKEAFDRWVNKKSGDLQVSNPAFWGGMSLVDREASLCLDCNIIIVSPPACPDK